MLVCRREPEQDNQTGSMGMHAAELLQNKTENAAN